MHALADDIAMLMTGLAIVLFTIALRLLPRHDPFLRPWRWLLGMARGGLLMLLAMDLLDDLAVSPDLTTALGVRKLGYRTWEAVNAAGGLWLYWRLLRAQRTAGEAPHAPDLP